MSKFRRFHSSSSWTFDKQVLEFNNSFNEFDRGSIQLKLSVGLMHDYIEQTFPRTDYSKEIFKYEKDSEVMSSDFYL